MEVWGQTPHPSVAFVVLGLVFGEDERLVMKLVAEFGVYAKKGRKNSEKLKTQRLNSPLLTLMIRRQYHKNSQN